MKIEFNFKYNLQAAGDFIWDHSDKLFAEFGISKYAELISVSFSGDGVKLVYTLSTGRHISDFIDVDDYNNWVDKLIGEPK